MGSVRGATGLVGISASSELLSVQGRSRPRFWGADACAGRDGQAVEADARGQSGGGVALQGPRRISDAGGVALDKAADAVLRMARVVCESGADLIWLAEAGEHPPQDTDEYLAVTAPIWGTIRFYQSIPALHLAGSADLWLDTVLDADRGVIPCIDPIRSPKLSDALKSVGTYGAIVGNDPLTPDKAAALRAFALEPGCQLFTSESDWFGRVTAREFQSRIDQWKMLINP